MKIIIEIPDEFGNDLKDKFSDFFGRIRADLRDYPSHDKLCGNYEMETIDMFLKSFDSAKVFSDMTNGDMIKVMFPDIEVKPVNFDGKIIGYDVWNLDNGTYETYFTKDFWDAPYKKEVEK